MNVVAVPKVVAAGEADFARDQAVAEVEEGVVEGLDVITR